MAVSKGTIAKENLMQQFIAAVGDNYLGNEDGKKFYFTSTENGEPVQVCVTMTCPKTVFAASGQAQTATPTPASTTTTISAEDRAAVEELMAALGL